MLMFGVRVLVVRIVVLDFVEADEVLKVHLVDGLVFLILLHL